MNTPDPCRTGNDPLVLRALRCGDAGIDRLASSRPRYYQSAVESELIDRAIAGLITI